MSDLNGKTALVTGASRGIGRAVAIQLAKSGAYVAVNYSRDEAGAKQTLSLIEQAGGQGELLLFDVADSKAVKEAVRNLGKSRDGLDILVANSGISRDNMAALLSDEDFHQVMQVNAAGAFYCARAAIRPMLKKSGGRIIFISSVVGLHGNAGQAAYSASKAALIGLTKSLARELAARNILVNAVAPGYIETAMTKDISEKSKELALDSIPLGRTGKPEDVAGAVLFLAGEQSSFITGQVLVVDGGMTM